MWALRNKTVYAADRNWTRDRNGVHHWLVAVKASFLLSSAGKLALADEQPPPLLAPQHRGDPARSSLRLDSDLLAVKAGTDLLLEGCAHAPRGDAAGTVPVTMRAGEIDKTLLVHGTRVYYKGAFGLTTTRPLPFVTQPITYEHAFGGTDTSDPDPRRHAIDARNPIGRGFAVDDDRLNERAAHQVEYTRGDPRKVGPAGFGPLASFWSPRRERAGTYDAAWADSKRPLLPDDYDERFAQCSPDDQRPRDPMRGGETVALINLTPAGILRFELPRIALRFRTHFGARVEERPGILTLVFVDTDAERARVDLVWQSALRVPAPETEHLDLTEVSERPASAA
jgi:hypothetical protein